MEFPVTSDDSSSSSCEEPVEKSFNGKTSEQDIVTNHSVNLNLLQPVELMVIKLDINGQQVSALLDSGASSTLIKSSMLSVLGAKIDSHVKHVLYGLGETSCSTMGVTNLTADYYGMKLRMSADIVSDEVCRYPIVLGEDFLRLNKFCINCSKRKVAIKSKDGSTTSIYLNNDNSVKYVICEEIPVYSTKKVIIKDKETAKIPIRIGFMCERPVNDNELLYFEGDSKCPSFETLNGIVDNKCSNPYVFACVLPGSRGVVRKNEIVGKVSTLFTVVDDVSVDVSDKEWNIDSLRSKVALGDHLSKDLKDKIYNLLYKNRIVFSHGDSDVGTAKVAPHHIELFDHAPIWQKPRRFADPVNQEIERQCLELLSLDILEHSDSQWSSPVVPVWKPDGTLRLCIDYRKVNAVTRTEKFPMPNLENCIYRGSKVKYFTKLDLVRGYYQVPLDDESRQYTAFSTVTDHYQFKRLSFGLRNSGIAFQKTMQQILSPLSCSNIIIYIDDILIMNESFEEHAVLVNKVLSTLGDSGIKLKVNKCDFFRREVNFLGHVINCDGIRKSPEYVEKVKNITRPVTVSQLRKFLGLINFQRKFISRCSELSKPLSEITGGPKRKVIKWTPEQCRAFEMLKDEVCRDVLLAYPDYDSSAEKLELYVDASGTGAGATLMQKQGGKHRTIAYASMSFSTTQISYSATERELVALRWGIQTMRSFVFGVPFLLFTDHKPLVFLDLMSVHNSRLMRTLEELAEYNFEVRYIPGPSNESADFLSRLNETTGNFTFADNHKHLPKGCQLIKSVDGGGDSMFESLLICLRYVFDEDKCLPDNYQQLREMLVNELVTNKEYYKLNLTKIQKRQLQMMKSPGAQPFSEVLLAACKLFDVQIFVYHGTRYPVVFRDRQFNEKTISIYLQCVSLVHYNPVHSRKSNSTAEEEAKVINYCGVEAIDDVQPQPEADVSFCDDALDLCYVDVGELDCVHSAGRITNNAVIVGGKHFCCMLDTGAQVSLMDVGVLNQFSPDNIVIHDCDSSLVGLGNDETKVGGYANLKLRLYDHHSETLHQFALFAESSIPVCFFLGANFLAANNLELDFSCGVLSQILAAKTELNCMMSSRNVDDAVVCNFYVLGSVSVDRVDSLPCGWNNQVDSLPCGLGGLEFSQRLPLCVS